MYVNKTRRPAMITEASYFAGVAVLAAPIFLSIALAWAINIK